MPEGHTIHRLARQHRPLLTGKPVAVSSPQGRFAEGAGVLDGRHVTRVDAYGKHLFYRFRGDKRRGLWLHVHLGLFGVFRSGQAPAPVPRGAIRLRMVTDAAWMDLRGPTACEVLEPAGRAAVLARLGPDPLRRDADPDQAWARLSRSARGIGSLLMDQRVIAGIGNVYRAESLFRSGLDPFRAGATLHEAEWSRLWSDLRNLLRSGVSTGRIITTRPEDRSSRSQRVPTKDAHYVYRRAGLPCRVCGAVVRTSEVDGRRLYWCPECQSGSRT